MNRDEFAKCPLDQSALDPDPDDRKLTCRTCEGAFVTEAEVSWMISEITHSEAKPLELDKQLEGELVRTCPRCLGQMEKFALHGIQIDRCEPHGLWFDPEEMQRILNEVGLGAVPKMQLHEKIMTGAFGAGFIAINVIRFIFFMPR
jgi:TFIIB-like protein